MLRIQPYVDDRHRENLRTTFTEIFGYEISDFAEFQRTNLSFVCTARTGVIQAFILVKECDQDVTPFEISFLGVAPRYRHQGYAQRLIEMVIGRSPGIRTTVLNSNHAAVKLYEKLGFDLFYTNVLSITMTWGVKYRCFHCKTVLKPMETIWDTIPVGLGFGTNGLEPRLSREAVCRGCRTRVES
jgi:GNAT superfamily N-acetyltransferase